MKLFHIESRFIILTDRKIAEYRRLVTPLFVKKITTKYYKKLTKDDGYACCVLVFCFPATGWAQIHKNDKVKFVDDDMSRKLDLLQYSL